MKPISKKRPGLVLVALFAALSLFAAACGSDAEEGSGGGGDSDGLRIAIVAPSASDDLAFSQSMVDAVNTLDGVSEIAITDGTFIVEDAAAAVTGYAEDGFDMVVVHGTQFGASLEEIAPNFPDVTFAWGTASDTLGQPNIFSYAPAADQGGYVEGVIAGNITESNVIGVIGPVEAGDAVAYIEGFQAGVASVNPDASVEVTYTGSFSDVALMTEAANAFVANGADVLTGSSQAVVGAVGVADSNGLAWFGTQANQTELSETSVVASQVYHWEVVLEEMIALMEAGTPGGQSFFITLENDGLVVELNEAYSLPDGVADQIDAATAGIIDGSITPS